MSIGYVEACFQLSKSKIDSRQSGSKDLNRHDSGRALACFAGIKDVRSHGITEVTLLRFHLSSNNYSRTKDNLTPDEVKSASGIKAYFENFSYATELREMEADTVITHCKDAERVVIMGDLNEVSGGSSMRMFAGAGYKDVWSKGGFGYGATIHHPLPYRIDLVLYNSGLKLKGIKKIDAEGISDHDALVAVFDLE